MHPAQQSNKHPPQSTSNLFFKSPPAPAQRPGLFSPPPIISNHIRQVQFLAPNERKTAEGFKKAQLSFFPSSPSLFDFCFPGTKARGSFLSSFRADCYGRLYEKILSRQQKSPIWTLKPASPSPSASSRQRIGKAKHKLLRKPTKRLISSFPPTSRSQPDGRNSTLLLTLPTSIFLVPRRSATDKKRSVSQKSVIAVPVSSRSIS